ncbi:MAG: hypothetical protein SGCHY_000792 [Lobulomycetales sp.]
MYRNEALAKAIQRVMIDQQKLWGVSKVFDYQCQCSIKLEGLQSTGQSANKLEPPEMERTLVLLVRTPPKMASYQAIDQKKEDFRVYLEKNGIIDALTKVLVGLYEESDKPENPVDFIKQFLGSPSEVDVEALREENEQLKQKVVELKASLEELSSTANESAVVLAPTSLIIF